MDPMTHTLVGANLAATRLREKTRLASAALVVGANLPDIDAILYFTGHQDLALGFRRGWTHGVLALVVLPFLLTGLLLLWDRLRPDPERRAEPRWLLLLSFLAILTHPALDWLNNYGMRWLMPFRGTWSYGDSVFIMDPWLWVILGTGWLAGRRATKGMVIAFAICVALVSLVVAERGTRYLVIVAVVALVLLAVLFLRTPPDRARAFARLALAAAALYIGGRLGIHELTERRVARELAALGRLDALLVSPQPLDPLAWDVVARFSDGYRYGRYSWQKGEVSLEADRLPLPVESPEWAEARRHPSVRGFMTWARFPWYEIERLPNETRVHIYDARYMTVRRARGFGGAVVVLEKQ
jgi:inner membrane protein